MRAQLWVHLPVVPIALPMLAGAIMLALGGEQRRTINAIINVAVTFALIAVAVTLLYAADHAPGGIAGVYRLGNWPAPFAIVLVADRLAAMMVLLTSLLAFAAVVLSLARWHRAGVLFHPLFQFLLMGVNGAFLTGDLFNLFVFFEVLLAASYGLALHGSGTARVTSGLHYIAINLVVSLCFLVGVSLIYGVVGTLNMADIASRIAGVRAEDRALLEAGAGILGIAFLVKAGMWPLSFWLPHTYVTATPPVSAIFAILTKVGAYVVLRLWLLFFGADAGVSAQLGSTFLLAGGIATLIYGTIGCLASQDLKHLAAHSVLVSAGTVLAAVALNQPAVTAAALFYLVSSTLGLGALFLLIELAERGREPGADVLAVTRELYGEGDDAPIDEQDEVGIAIPAAMGVLGLAFISCALVISGMPPLAGFLAKFAMLTSALSPVNGNVPGTGWVLLIVLMVSGLLTFVAMIRAGIRTFWVAANIVPRVGLIEIIPVLALIAMSAVQAVNAGPVMLFMQATANSLHGPQEYIRNVLGATTESGEWKKQ
ncbi:MAG: monovalent cation/H+ antiporter subunit D [Xanthobacteraceae bacterium]|nr:monovalent cation/H+ antiporter subunit D [Xanthobacteraceae bacterium]